MADVIIDARKVEILRNVYRKLDNLPLGFGIPSYSDTIVDADVIKIFGIDLNDTLREMRITTMDDVEADSILELYVENRTVYYALRRFRLSASIFFKFSTAVDGKTVDKTSVPKMIAAIIAEYDAEFKKWRGTSAGSIWNRSVT